MLLPRPNVRGIPEIMVCEILLFVQSFGALDNHFDLQATRTRLEHDM